MARDLIQIDANIPMPTPQRRPSVYPFADMTIGDSFFLTAGGVSNSRERVRSRITDALKRARCAGCVSTEWMFATRYVKGGVRCWRIDDKDGTP